MNEAIALLATYKYLVLVPLSIAEGPITTVIAGFLVTLGLLDIGLVFLIIILGDIIGDTIAYSFGRFGGRALLNRYGYRIGITAPRVEQAKKYFDTNHKKALVMSKLIHGIGTAGLFAAGSLKIPYGRFIGTCFLISLVQSVILLVLGIFFGHAYEQIGQYFDYFAAGGSVIVLALIAFFVSKKFTK
jgi:membrane protein DedA with SNARE-associated domain